ncbi:MAG: adenine deaminase [Rhizobiaceae bacterium]|nr:adenine deaminase [Rhizobiaceae bacterium]
MSVEQLGKCIDQGRGLTQSDLVLKGGRFLDLVTGELVESDIAICGDKIVGTFGEYAGIKEIDISNKIVVPGFIDTHLHIESSLVTPFEFDRCVTPRGITTAICDPHEIANVCGIEGIAYFVDCAQHTVLDIRVQLSSCVPATNMETSGARLDFADLEPYRDNAKVIGLAEFMNFPGVLNKDPVAMEKLAGFEGRHIDGHAPLLGGRDLNGYLAAGIGTEHEATSAEEALEKMRKGMHILIREGSVSKDLEALMPIITERSSAFIAFCTDDRNPLDIAEYGHIDHMIRTAIQRGALPLAVYRAASLSAARAFGLTDRGMVAPGWRADLVIVDSLEGCNASQVIVAGNIVNEALFKNRTIIPPIGRNSVHANTVNAIDFTIPATNKPTRVIGIVPGRIITENLVADMPMENGSKRVDLANDNIKMAVVERHGKNGNIGTCFVNGFGLKSGAIASTVCHDHHNIAVIGVDDSDMAIAVNRLGEIEGGFVVVQDGQVIGEVALPIAGLMSLMSYEDVRDALGELRGAAISLGVTLEEPFLQLAFLALPVIPHLKLTDMGLVDVDKFAFVDD